MAKQLTTVSAEDFLNRLAIFKVNMDVCQINKDSLTVKKLEQERKEKIDPHKDVKLKNLTQINKNSASPTTVSFGDLVAGVIGVDNDLPVSIKMFRDVSNEHDLDFYPTQGLRYEAEVYKQIYEDIIVKNRSPNFVSFIAFGCCKLEGKCMLITERVGNGAWFGLNKLFPVQTLFQLFPRLNDLNRAQVLFQIIYSIGVLNKLKIVHNDLHTVNILVVDFGDYRIPLSFTVNGKRYVMKTRYVPYIFDWDRGYSEKLGPNRFVDSEKIVFNTFDEHRDLYTVFCCLDWDTPAMNTYKNTDTYRYKENNEAIMTLSKREVDAI
ncbi:MAG: hypothetical protein JSS09_04335, partial [Verrucomicrobia bacterium]|nr:hypothetical protein [Verrucomicrobiota bacterium]